MSTVSSAARTNLFLAPTGFLLTIVSSALITRWLGPETYADYATLTSLLAWMVLLAETGCNIGIGRYLQEAAHTNAEGTLYLTLQLRRWIVVAFLSAAAAYIGPLWAASAGLPENSWRAGVFLLVSLLCALTLHNQLASYTLMTAFLHRRMLLLNQTMMIVRALTLGILAGFLRKPIDLIGALVMLASVEAFFMHQNAKKSLTGKFGDIPKSLATKAQIHGLVGLFDKMTTALGNGPFLILILTGTHNRAELAMLAVATDLLQKMLGVIGLPFSNLITPMLNDSRKDFKRFTRQVSRLGALTIVDFSVACAAILTVLGAGLPLLVGTAYMAAVPIAMIWLFPLFFEAAIRMVWGTALLTLDYKKWLMGYNALFGVVTLLVLFLFHKASIETLLVMLGGIRVIFSGFLLHKAAKIGLLPPQARPAGILFVAAFCCSLGLLVQTFIDPGNLILRLIIGLTVYSVPLALGFRFLPLLPPLAYETICQMSGKFKPYVPLFLYRPRME